MVDAGVISYKELHPWADSLLVTFVEPPGWLCDVAMKKYSPDVSKTLGGYAWGEPFDPVNRGEVDDEHLSSLYLRYERHELSWATFLDLAGRYADCADGKWECEEFFQLLNGLEDADFSSALDQEQRITIERKLANPLSRVRAVYGELQAIRRR
jgi:hypothetical protein